MADCLDLRGRDQKMFFEDKKPASMGFNCDTVVYPPTSTEYLGSTVQRCRVSNFK